MFMMRMSQCTDSKLTRAGVRAGDKANGKREGERWDVRPKQEPLSISKVEQLDEGVHCDGSAA